MNNSSVGFARFQNQVALITGAGRGLGAAIAQRLGSEGAALVLNDIEGSSSIQELSGRLEREGIRAGVALGDVSNPSDVKRVVKFGVERFGTIDILVNNAGITRDALLLKTTEEQWDQVIAVNLKGSFLMGQEVARVMSEKKRGRIVNLASVAWLGNMGQTNYAASKAGVVGMTRTWALELARYGITVNAIAPGLIETEMTQAIPEEIRAKFLAKIPHRRMGKPEEIAALVAYLASQEAAYMTGQCLQFDGGLTCGIAGA
jgi:3-oxoacyl-(acyl-carrier-protein) reductase